MTQELIETSELKSITVDEAQRAHYRQTLARIEQEAPKIIAGVKNKAGADKEAAWRLEVRTFIRSIEDGSLGVAKAFLHRRKKEIEAEINSYVDPCENLIRKSKAVTDAWYAEELRRAREREAKLKEKTVAKAEEHRDQKVQTLMDLGKTQAAMVAAQKPLVVSPPPVVMPKIKNAVWKTEYSVEIVDLGALLKYIAGKPAYYGLIDVKTLTASLKGLAAQLQGNMQEFKGVECTVKPSSVIVGGPK